MGQGRGGDLNAARGSIYIDTSQPQTVPGIMQGVAQGINNAMGNINASSTRAQSGLAGLAGAARGLAGAFGIGVGVAGVAQLVRAGLAAEQLATAYNRQALAARNLAGSQAELNDLLAVYDRATGGIADKATALANVTKLMSVGFADNAQELEQFATAIRGISVAMGMSTDTVTQNLILELFSQRGARLDQLGLQYDKVRKRADELRASDSTLTQQMAYQKAVLEQAIERFGKLATSGEGAATGMEKLGKAITNLRLLQGEISRGPLGLFGNLAAGGINLFIEGFRKAQNALENFLDTYIKAAQILGRHTGMPFPMLTWEQERFIASAGERDASRRRSSRRSVGPAIIEGEREARIDWGRGITEINRRVSEEILQQGEDYQRQRAESERNYQQTVTREAEDYARNRQRQEQDLFDDIAEIHADAARREISMAEDLARSIANAQSESADRIAEIREDSQKRLSDLEEDYQRDREKAARDHRDRLLDAAGRLDAKAIAEANRNFARQEEEAKESHKEQRDEIQKSLDERIADEKESLAKSIAQQREAFDRRLADAREADRIRIEDMNADFIKRQEQEDVDRGIRLERMAEDHADQLAEMDRAHGDRIQQIKDHAQDELNELETQNTQALVDLGVRNQAWIDELRRRDDAALQELERFLNPIRVWMREPTAVFPTPSGAPIGSSANAVPAAMSNAPLGLGGSMGGATFTGDVHVTIAGSTNMGEDAMYRVARQAFVDALTEVANP